ncbi:NAD(P)-binding protein [Hypoxylon sp. NC1633]|nr:NAD(P)-binding protein [Hypoxylon sp. NC1633]
MTKIAIVSASSQLAREVIDKLVETKKHEIIALVRKDPSQYPPQPNVKWVQTNYEKGELVGLFHGVETVLCFFPVHLDAGNATQKRLIDAAVEAGVKRFAPSEWACGVKLESSLDAIPWYAGKIEVGHYLENLNKERKVIEYTRFQLGSFMNYLGHPHKTTNHVATIPFGFDFEHQYATVVEGSLDSVFTFTTVQDIAGVVARAVEYEGEWPAIGGIRGSRITVGEMLQLGESIGKPFTINWLNKSDLEAEKRTTEHMQGFDLHNSSPEQLGAFLQWATRGILLAVTRGVYDVTDEWNKILPDYEFTQVEDFVKKLWGNK